jgi:Bacterial Ig-like domain (group 3)
MSTTAAVAHPTFEVGSFDAETAPPSGAFTPAQIEKAYGFNEIMFNGVAGDGAGETIAIVDAYDDPNIQSDLNTFDSQFGLPATTVMRVNQSGGTTSFPTTDPTGGWELEESLDVEWAHAIAPGATIMLVEANSPNDNDLLTAVQYAEDHANVVSMSWGGPEFSGETADDSEFFDKPGVAFVASAGDAGAPASWPSASPNVLSVGGTALTLGSNNVWSSEVGWDESGGGPSADESQPSYQQGVVMQTSTNRATPDVAYDASPSTGFAVYDSNPYQGTTEDWVEVGGTSAGAPQWSALLAIADQGLAQSHQGLNSTNPQEVMDVLYQNQADFHDITSGTSTGAPHYSAGPGYDYVTGLGSPMANLVVGSLVGTSPASPDTLVLSAPTAQTAGTSFSLTVTAENSSKATDTGFLGTIEFTSSDVQAGLPAKFTFTPTDDGTATFTVTLKTAGSQSITATDTAASTVTGTLSGIIVSPAAASKFVLSGLPSNSTAGTSHTVTVTAEDPLGNVATGYRGTVEFTSSATQAILPAHYSFTGSDLGVHQFAITFETAGSQSLTVQDTPVTLETAGTQTITATDSEQSSISGFESGITVQAAAASILKVTGFPASDVAGAPESVTVTAYDAYGNVATSDTGTVSLTSTDPKAVLPSSFTFPGTTGTHTFFVTLETAGVQSITATQTGPSSLTATEAGITVQPAAAQILAVTGFPATFMAGAANTVTVTAYDAYGNVATGYTGTISFSSSDAQALLPPNFSFIASDAGTSTFSVTLQTAGSQSITATDQSNSSITGMESGITVRAVPQVSWSTPLAIVYGTPLSNAQLDASAGMAGTFTYTPAAGAILNAGSGQTLSVTFEPQDSTYYTMGAGTATITVLKATPSLKVTASGGTFDGSPFPAAVAIAGVDHTAASSLDNVTPVLTYYDGSGTAGTSLGSAPPSAPGTFTVMASFPGDVDYSAVVSAPVTFVIGPGAATLALAASVSSAVSGQPVSFTATVAAAAGTVTFSDGTTQLGTVPVDGSGMATLATSALPAGPNAITATYSGGADFFSTASAPSSVTVAQAATQVAVVQNSVFKRKRLTSIRLTAEIKRSAPGGGVPTGEVTIELVTKIKKKEKITTLGTAAISGGEATFTLQASKVLDKAVTIIYSGDANDKPTTFTTAKLR